MHKPTLPSKAHASAPSDTAKPVAADPVAARRSGPVKATFSGALALACALASAPPAAAADPPLRFPRDRAIDVHRIALDLDIDLEARRVSGAATLEATALIVPLEEVTLDAVDLDVGSVADGAGRALRFHATADALVIRLAEPIRERGAKLVLAIRYAAKPAAGLHFFGPSATEPEVPQQMWSQNESLEARRWLPCIDTPEERQATEIAATVPSGFQVLSNGRLVSREQVDGGRERWHYAQAFEHPAYLITLVVGRFHVAREEWDGIPLAYWVPPEHARSVERSFATTPAMLDCFSKRLGVRYPFEKYDQVVVEQFIFGGMENTGATTLNDYTLHDERAHLDYRSDGLIAHELGHQWFGDLVTCRDWTHIWLNEGFASYCEALWEEHARGRDAYLETLLGKAGGALWGGRDLPLVRRRYGSAPECFGGGTYPKGAWVLHMLRVELGDADFFAGLQRYLETYGGRPAETEDFRQVLERVSGRSLGRFFQQWTERPGHPVLQARVGWRAAERLLEVQLRQTQPGEPFHITVPVAVTEAGGARRVVRVRVEEAEARLLLPLAARPAMVTIDPDLELLCELELTADRDLLLAALAQAPSLVERVQAARALARDHQEPVIEALARAAVDADNALPVRTEAVRALGGMPVESARDRLLEVLGSAAHVDLHWREGRPFADGLLASVDGPEREALRTIAVLRRATVDALSDRRGDALVTDALCDLVEGGETSYAVLAAAADALGQQRGERSLKALLLLADMPSHTESVRGAALRALAAREEMDGLAVARRYAAPGTRWRVRAPAIGALGRFAQRKELAEATRDEVVAELAAMLDEPSERMRREAAQALRDVGQAAGRSLATLDALARHDADAVVREAAKAAAAAVRKGAPADQQVERLRAEVERSVAEAKALRERLERLEARVGEPRGQEPERRGGPW